MGRAKGQAVEVGPLAFTQNKQAYAAPLVLWLGHLE